MKKENIKKKESIDLATKIFNDNSIVIILNYKKLNAKSMTSLRRELKGKQANLKILKNTLVKRAIKDANSNVLFDDLSEQVAFSYSNEPVSLSNVLVNFSKKNENVVVKVGFIKRKKIDLSVINDLAALESIEKVRTKFVCLLKASPSKFVRILDAYQKK